MIYFSTKMIKCVISRVLLLNVEYSYYPFGIFLGGSVLVNSNLLLRLIQLPSLARTFG